jgi:hypothetical protein
MKKMKDNKKYHEWRVDGKHINMVERRNVMPTTSLGSREGYLKLMSCHACCLLLLCGFITNREKTCQSFRHFDLASLCADGNSLPSYEAYLKFAAKRSQTQSNPH